jgi:hypothetical protein
MDGSSRLGDRAAWPTWQVGGEKSFYFLSMKP